jgi:uncharacterized protein (DUF2062 family)
MRASSLRCANWSLQWPDIISALEQVKGEKWEEFSPRHGDWGRYAALWLGRRRGRYTLSDLGHRDTPEAIAGGVAIGIFFGFTPLFGLKTLSAIFFAWLTGSNILAAVISGALHDVILPFMPIIYRWELGYWLLGHPHRWPPSLGRMHWEGAAWRDWTTFFTVRKPCY